MSYSAWAVLSLARRGWQRKVFLCLKIGFFFFSSGQEHCFNATVAHGRLQFNNTKYSALLKLLAAVLEGALPGSSIVLLGYFNAHV